MQYAVAGSWRLCVSLEWLCDGERDVIVQLEPGHPDVEVHARSYDCDVVVNVRHAGLSRNAHTVLMRARDDEATVWVPDDASDWAACIYIARRDLLRVLGQWCFRRGLIDNLARCGVAARSPPD